MESDSRPNTFAKNEDEEETVKKVDEVKTEEENKPISDQMEEWKQYYSEYKGKAKKYIKANPEKSFFMGMGIGALIALILFKRR